MKRIKTKGGGKVWINGRQNDSIYRWNFFLCPFDKPNPIVLLLALSNVRSQYYIWDVHHLHCGCVVMILLIMWGLLHISTCPHVTSRMCHQSGWLDLLNAFGTERLNRNYTMVALIVKKEQNVVCDVENLNIAHWGSRLVENKACCPIVQCSGSPHHRRHSAPSWLGVPDTQHHPRARMTCLNTIILLTILIHHVLNNQSHQEVNKLIIVILISTIQCHNVIGQLSPKNMETIFWMKGWPK